MDFDSYFDLSKPLKKIIVPKPSVGGRMATQRNYEKDCEERSKNEASGFNYAEVYKKREDQDCLKINEICDEQNVRKKYCLSEIDDVTSFSCTLSNLKDMQESLNDIYMKFNFSHFPETNLAISSSKEKILTSIDSVPVVVIHGATGSGKSTQVPQFILDNCKLKNIRCNIVVTQPRRIAAISIAQHVATQRKWPLGSVVGYQVGLDNKTSENTILSFVTVGILLQKLVKAKHMNDYTHIIIDEVHERDKDMDFLLLIVRKFLRTNSRQTKVILMSATIDVDRFAHYFSMPFKNKGLQPAAIIGVTKLNKHKVQDFYLDELGPLGELPEIQSDDATISFKTYLICVRLIRVFDKLDTDADTPGSVLVFLPGLHEIEELDSLLQDPSNRNSEMRYNVIPLHSTITTEEQKRVFQNSVSGVRKIILSTNIAESSITVPDIMYVIDFCLTKQLMFDSTTSLSSLQLAWASRNSCIQRAGRAGRVTDGRVYRLVPKHFYDNYLQTESKPEMLRCSLERLVLFTKKLNLGSDLAPHEILALALDPPNLSQIKKTILILKEIGALLIKCNGVYTDFDGDMTFLGHVMSVMPVDVRITKLIILGYLFSVLDESIIMGVGMSVKNVFSTPFKEGMNAYNSKLSWADGTCSDLIAILNVFKVWEHNIEENLFTSCKKGGNIVSWARRHFLQHKVLKEMHQLIGEVKARLRNFNIIDTRAVRWSHLEKPLILKIVICGAFYPDYFVRMPNQIDEREAVKLLAGRMPHNTVYLQGMDPKQPGILYAKSIKNALSSCANNMLVSFDNNNNKVYIQFPLNMKAPYIQEGSRQLISTVPGNIPFEMYRAVRLRQLGIPIKIPILSLQEAEKRAKQMGIEKKSNTLDIVLPSSAPELPGIETSALEICITHVVDPGHFWAQNAEMNQARTQITYFLSRSRRLISAEGNIIVGQLYAAPYENEYFRVRVNSIIPQRNKKNNVLAFFIDFGNSEEIPETELCMLPPEIENYPAQAMECVLCKIQPSVVKHSQALWTDEAFEFFIKCIENNLMLAKIYSVSQGIVSLELFQKGKKNIHGHFNTNEISINQLLLDNELAQPAEESYLSKMNHEMRLLKANMEVSELKVYNSQQNEGSKEHSLMNIEFESPRKDECKSIIQLKGPYSPLEMKVYSLRVYGPSASLIKIDGDSVNTVLIDPEPQDMHQRLLVAAHTSTNEIGDRLKLRFTTLMPNLRGFHSLMSFLFCPTMELRTDKHFTRFVSALCGLGYYDDDIKRPLFREHDIIVNTDVEIDKEDINTINCFRYWLNVALHLEDKLEEPNVDSENISVCQKKIQHFLLTLLQKNRKSLPIEHAEHEDRWGNINTDTLLLPGSYQLSSKAIYNLHNCIEINSSDDYEIKQHLTYLLNISKRITDFPSGELTCRLCDVTVLALSSLRVHLASEMHKVNCKKLNIEY